MVLPVPIFPLVHSIAGYEDEKIAGPEAFVLDDLFYHAVSEDVPFAVNVVLAFEDQFAVAAEGSVSFPGRK